MSDDLYDVSSSLEQFNVTIEVFQGKFRGENDFYKYKGSFSTDGLILKGVVSITDKNTGKQEFVRLYSSSFQDKKFKATVNIKGKKLNLTCQKANSQADLS